MYQALLLLFFLLASLPSFAKSGANHVADMLSLVFDNANVRSPSVRSCLYEFTKTIDNFEIVKALPLGKDGHRLYGHWGFSDSIPFNKKPLKGMLEKIAVSQGNEAADAAKQRIISAWRTDVAHMEELSARMLGVQGRTAKGFAGVLYDVHLLGDYTGVKLDALQNVDGLKNDLAKNINRMFGNNSPTSKDIIKGLDSAYKSGANAIQKSEKMLEFISGSDKFRSSFQNLLRQDRFVASIIKTPIMTETKGIKTADELKKIVRREVKGDTKVAPALIHNGRLLVAMESGVGAGLMMFAVEAGIPTWQYVKGEILKPEFEEKLVHAAINGAGVGGATAVMVILGANPAGLVLIGVATGTYIAIDKLQQIYKENKNCRYLTKDDLIAFGIQPDSVLDIKIDKGIPLNVSNW